MLCALASLRYFWLIGITVYLINIVGTNAALQVEKERVKEALARVTRETDSVYVDNAHFDPAKQYVSNVFTGTDIAEKLLLPIKERPLNLQKYPECKKKDVSASMASVDPEANRVRISGNPGNGDCFFMMLSYSLVGHNDCHLYLRKLISAYVEENEDIRDVIGLEQSTKDFTDNLRDSLRLADKENSARANHQVKSAAALFLNANIYRVRLDRSYYKGHHHTNDEQKTEASTILESTTHYPQYRDRKTKSVKGHIMFKQSLFYGSFQNSDGSGHSVAITEARVANENTTNDGKKKAKSELRRKPKKKKAKSTRRNQ